MTSIFDNSIFLSDYDDSIGAISYNDFQNNSFDLRNEFSIDIFGCLFQNPRPKFITEQQRTNRGRPNKFNKRKKVHSSSCTDNIIIKFKLIF